MTKKALLRKATVFLFIAVWLIWIIVVGYYVKQYFSGTVQVEVANLIAPIHESAELPIYSKFYVTQTVTLPEALKISLVTIPVRQPAGAESKMFVSVQNDAGQIITDELELRSDIKKMDIPVSFEKQSKSLTIFLSASDVSWKVKDTEAPRIYREKSLRGYREGKMTIAGIDKEGNIGLSVYASYTRVNFMKKQYGENRKVVSYWLRDLLLLFLVLVWPAIFLDLFVIKKQK